MGIDPLSVQLVPSDWFSSSGEYQGEGYATFSHPEGAIVGPCQAHYDRTGAITIEMLVQKFGVQDSSISITKLLAGAEIVIGDDGVPTLVYDSDDDLPANLHCDSLTIRGPEWELSAGNSAAVDGVDFSWQRDTGAQVRIRLKALHCTYRVDGAKPAMYWTVTLTNLLTDFTQQAQPFDTHPLRIYPTPQIPISPSTPEDVKLALAIRANEKNRLILFEHNGTTVFIEALADYDASKALLESGQQSRLITSIMVGDVNGRSIAFDDIEEWVPYYSLLMLGLATGHGVESPWIEFRDDEGRLVQRIHVHSSFRLPFGGRPSLNNGVHTGIGQLLTRALAVPRDLAVIRACQLLMQSGPHGLDHSEVFADVVRALDGLTEHFGFSSQMLLQRLSTGNVSAVQNILQEASRQIKHLATAAQAAGNTDEVNALRTIADRTPNAANKERKFGLALVDLLNRFHLDDAHVMDNHFLNQPRLDGKTWVDLVTSYRGMTIHVGHLNQGAIPYDFDEAHTLALHLRDILLRLCLILNDYDGTYQPMTRLLTFAAALDWVKKDTSPKLLGYR